MIDEIKKVIEKAISEEQIRATKENGPIASQHEGHSLLLEEIQEAERESQAIKFQLSHAWSCIMKNDFTTAAERIYLLSKRAENLACEAVQIAAVARRFAEIKKK